MPKYYNSITQEIVDYPEDAAALFDVLKPVPSEKADKHSDEDSDNQLDITIEKPNTVDPKVKASNAKIGDADAK